MLIAIDGGEAAELVLKEALPFLKVLPDVRVSVLTVTDIASIAVGQGYDSTLMQQSLDHQADELKQLTTSVLGSIPFDFYTQMGYPTEEILKKANAMHCDLLIMGTHGRTGLDHLLIGSVAEKTLRQARCKVLVIPVSHKAA